MASFRFLWKNRAKFPFKSILFYKAWAKRILLLKDVMVRNARRSMLVSKGAKIHPSAETGELRIDGNRINLSIGEFSFLGKVYMALHEKVIIGSRVCINDGVQILTASHNVTDPKWSLIKAGVTIEDYAWIGTNALLLPGITIGRGAVVGAGAVVAKSVEQGSIVVGNPARPIPKKRTAVFDYNPCEFLAANQAWLKG